MQLGRQDREQGWQLLHVEGIWMRDGTFAGCSTPLAVSSAHVTLGNHKEMVALGGLAGAGEQ